MTKEVHDLLQIAHETLEDARVLFDKHRYPGTAERTYFAILHAASAMLLHTGVRAETHYGVKIKFGEIIAKSGKVDRRFGKILSETYDLRLDAEYVPEARSGISREVAEEQLTKAAEFLGMAEDFIRKAGGEVERN
jgi:uncharacterized protein (UPF0332 family)